MTERGILFSAPMVRALLGGMKTQTRRALKRQPWASCSIEEGLDGESPFVYSALHGAGPGHEVEESRTPCRCPYGQPGDRLWVRETWQGPLFDDMEAYRAEPDEFHKPEFCEYAADGGPAPEFMTMDDELVCRWRPSIHMPRWASRILLEVVSVRVERLQALGDQDAIAEGIERVANNYGNGPAYCDYRMADPDDTAEWFNSPIDSYRTLWESINGAGNWGSNPFVWVVEFKRVAP